MAIINPPITRNEATAIVEHAFGAERNLLGIVPLGGGQVNSTGMLILDDGQRLILRIAPETSITEAAPGWLSPFGLRREAAVIATAGPDLASLLPQTTAHDFTGSVIPRDWVLQEVMPGVPFESLLLALDDETSAAIWREVGAFMRSLHDRGRPPFGALVDGPRFDTWLELVRSDVAGLRIDFNRFALPGDLMERLEAAIERHAGILELVPPTLIHSDLNPAHIFITDNDEDGSLCLGGIIDLEYGRIADPLSDHLLASAIVTHDTEESSRAILAGYGDEVPGNGVDMRIHLAAALGAAWEATLLAFQQMKTVPALHLLNQHLELLEVG